MGVTVVGEALMRKGDMRARVVLGLEAAYLGDGMCFGECPLGTAH